MRFKIIVDVDYDEATIDGFLSKEDIIEALREKFMRGCNESDLLSAFEEFIVDDWNVEVKSIS